MLDSLLLRQSHDGRDGSSSPSLSKFKANTLNSVASPPRWQTRSPSSGWDLSSSPGLSYGSLRSSSSIPSGSRHTSVDYPSLSMILHADKHILPSFPSSSSMSDDELPPLTSDYDISELSEDFQLETDDDSEDLTHGLSPRKTFFAVSSERGQWHGPSFVPTQMSRAPLLPDDKSSDLQPQASQGLRIERHLRIADLLSAPEPSACVPVVQEAPLVSAKEPSRNPRASLTPHNDEDIFAQDSSSPSSPLPPSSPPLSPALADTAILSSSVDESPLEESKEPREHPSPSATAIVPDDRMEDAFPTQLSAEAISKGSDADQDASLISTQNDIPDGSTGSAVDLPLNTPINSPGPLVLGIPMPDVLVTILFDDLQPSSPTVIENSPRNDALDIDADQGVPPAVPEVTIPTPTTSLPELVSSPSPNPIAHTEDYPVLPHTHDSKDGLIEGGTDPSGENQHENLIDSTTFTNLVDHKSELAGVTECKRSRSPSASAVNSCSGSKLNEEGRSCKRRPKEDQTIPSGSKRPRKRRISARSEANDSAIELSACSISATLTTYPELPGLVIETLAMSRASSQTVPVLYNGLLQSRPTFKEERSRKEWEFILHEILEDGRRKSGVFEKIESRGKEDADYKLEAQWYYVPENDEDQERATLMRSMMPRPGKRSETKKSKQYYWRPLGKISRWDPEDDL